MLDPEVLQLSDLSLPPSKPSLCKVRLDDLFSQWLSLPETHRLVRLLLSDQLLDILDDVWRA